MRNTFIFFILFGNLFFAQAQNDVFFGHYMFNPSYMNAGWVGSEREAFVAFQHRTQWLGYRSSFDGSGGAPSTQMLTVIVPMQQLPISSLGINISNDQLGPVSNFQIQLPVSYSLDFRGARLHIGLAPAIFSQTQKFDELRFNDPSDPLNVGSRETQTRFNLGAGIFYTSEQSFFVGLGLSNLLRPGFDFGFDSLENLQDISMAINGGFTLDLSEQWKLSPTVLIRSNFNTYSFDLGGILTFNQRMWTGLTYRKDESAIVYLGYSLMKDNQLKVGYSFDLIIQNREAKGATSHELFLRYDLPNLVLGGRKAVKTPRFSY